MHAKNNKCVPFSPSRDAGFLLLPVVLLLVLVGALAFMANRSAPMAAHTGGGELEASRARLVAEAGLEHALWRANRNACTGYDLASTDFGTSSYAVNFTPNAGTPVDVVATGTTAAGASATLTRNDVPIYDGITTTVLQPDAATGIDDNPDAYYPNNNYGATDQMWVDDNNERGLIRFDLASIPAGAKVVRAVLALYKFAGTPPAGGDIHAYRVTRDWTEGTGDYTATGDGATWNTSDGSTAWTTAGVDFDATPVAGNTSISANGWKEWDITPLTDAWVSGAVANQGVVLKATPGVGYIRFHTSDAGNATLHPKLTITYYPCGCGGTTDSLLLQPGEAGEDTYIGEKFNTENFGDVSTLVVGTKLNDEKRALLRFDLSSLPAAATVSSAVLTLNQTNSQAGTISVHRLTRPWAEGDGSTSGGCYVGASWERYDTCSAWAIAGGDFDATASAATAVANPGPVSWDVTALVGDMQAGTYQNHGFLLMADSSVENAWFASGKVADTSTHPKLAIDYSCPCGVDCTPGPPPVRDYLDTLPLLCSEVGADNASAGSEDWTPWAWSEIGESADWCAGAVTIEPDLGDQSLRLRSPDKSVERELDLSDFENAWLTFDYRFVDVPAGNGLRVRVSANGGTDWVELEPINGPADHGDYQAAVYDLSVYRASNTRIAFQPSMPGGGGVNHFFIDDVKVSSEEPPAPPVGLVLPVDADSYVYQNSSGSNYGSDTDVYAGQDGSGPGRHYRSLLRFDLSALPVGATVLSATLRLYLTGGNGANVDLEVRGVSASWTEGTVTWTSSGGGAASATVYDTVSVNSSTPGWVEWTIPETLLHEWMDAVTPNHGLIVLGWNGKNRYGVFASRENATAANRPQLVVTYAE